MRNDLSRFFDIMYFLYQWPTRDKNPISTDYYYFFWLAPSLTLGPLLVFGAVAVLTLGSLAPSPPLVPRRLPPRSTPNR